jgi:hypothetical protein
VTRKRGWSRRIETVMRFVGANPSGFPAHSARRGGSTLGVIPRPYFLAHRELRAVVCTEAHKRGEKSSPPLPPQQERSGSATCPVVVNPASFRTRGSVAPGSTRSRQMPPEPLISSRAEVAASAGG